EFDPAGNLLIAGNVTTLAGQSAQTIAKIDPVSGGILFKTFYNAGGTRIYILNDITVNSTGEIFVAGSYATLTSPFYAISSIIKYTGSGSFAWEYSHPTILTASQDIMRQIAVDVDGNIISSGSLSFQPDPFTVGFKLLAVKLNAAGTLQWEKTFDPVYPGGFYPTDLKLYNNRVYVYGASRMSPGGNDDLVLVKYCDNAAPDILQASPVLVCSGSTASLTASTSPAVYQWNPNGESTSALNVTSSGLYSLTGIETDGCAKTSDTVQVDIKAIPTAPDICAVTVDTVSTHNIIYWDKTPYTDISHFIVYREDVTNIYTAVGYVPYDSLSEFHDYGANPNITTKRYKLTAVDTCGTESAKS
ncbi:MAG TPA: hypothetical protein VD905_08920, partial [Flavobacteriales bacterium]|nr:hypothetical protein [Flavobacteriales bacterium]